MKKLFIIFISLLLTQVAAASDFVKYNKLASPPPTSEAGTIYQFYDSSGVLKTINQSGTVAPVIGSIDLTSQVTGVLPTANGGTGVGGTAVYPTSGKVLINAANVDVSTNRILRYSDGSGANVAGSGAQVDHAGNILATSIVVNGNTNIASNGNLTGNTSLGGQPNLTNFTIPLSGSTNTFVGQLPAANGGTGVSSTAIFPTSGSLIYQSAGAFTNHGLVVFTGVNGNTVSSNVTLTSPGVMTFPLGTSLKFSSFSGSKALASTALGTVIESDTTSDELGSLSGVTSNVQTQLNNVTARTYPSSTTATSATCSVTCGTGTITGGGCQNSSGSVANVSSYASSTIVWSCTYLTAVGDCTAHAICM